jgi:hypothetical protein
MENAKLPHFKLQQETRNQEQRLIFSFVFRVGLAIQDQNAKLRNVF